MKVIWKYDLEVKTIQGIKMPVGTKPISVDVQRNVPRLWAIVDLNAAEKDLYTVYTFGTGSPIPARDFTHIGSYMLYESSEVYHVFMEETQLNG